MSGRIVGGYWNTAKTSAVLSDSFIWRGLKEDIWYIHIYFEMLRLQHTWWRLYNLDFLHLSFERHSEVKLVSKKREIGSISWYRAEPTKAMCSWMEVDIKQFRRMSLFYIYSECFGMSCPSWQLKEEECDLRRFPIIDKEAHYRGRCRYVCPSFGRQRCSACSTVDIVGSIKLPGFGGGSNNAKCTVILRDVPCNTGIVWVGNIMTPVDNGWPYQWFLQICHGCHDKMKTFPGTLRLECALVLQGGFPKYFRLHTVLHQVPQQKHVGLQLETHLVVHQSSISQSQYQLVSNQLVAYDSASQPFRM